MQSVIRNQKSRISNSYGFTYLALLAAIIIIGISMGAAGKYWQNVVQREKEDELLFRGDQYARAIERYYSAVPGRVQYPASLDDLLKDERTPTGKRYLRQKYKDPMTNEDFVEIRDQLRRIIGVRSSSEKTPLRQANFPEPYQEFSGKTKYSDWQFVPVLQPMQPGSPGRSPAPVQQR
jgi:type II secretory pathway pseudopilin PulG